MRPQARQTQEKVFVLEGHTKICLDFLTKQTHFNVNGHLRSLGGPRAVESAVRDRVIKRMQAWCLLAKEVVLAEHPDFEIIACFACFDLAEFPKDSLDKIIQKGRSDKFNNDLQNLARAFNVNEVGLTQEFWDYGARASIHHDKTDCSNVAAWQWAHKASSSAAARKRHPVSNLELVLAAYVSMSSSDSIIEHDFSRVKKLLGESRLHCKDGTENDLVMVLLSPPELDTEVVQRALYVWSELYSGTRGRHEGESRIDKGTKRAHRNDQTGDGAPPSAAVWAHLECC